VDREQAARLLADVAAGTTSTAEALAKLESGVLGDGDGFADLGFARVDTHRVLRTGDPEVVYAAGKTTEQVVAIVRRLRAAHPAHPILVTRASDEVRAAVRTACPDEPLVEDAVGRCVALGPLPRNARGRVAVVCAGTSDLPVAAEATFTARVFGAGVEQVTDVGVAGIHRLLAARPVLDRSDCVVVVAGMDGALPGVVAGLIGIPIVAVPTSVGYGAAFGGLAPLLTMLNACAPGVAVVNIDNGFGGGVYAARVARRSVPGVSTEHDAIGTVTELPR
jgi:NCAIR mutase (PurE)-related protein